MADEVTATTDIPTWIPSVIATTVYDTMLEPEHALLGWAEKYGELEGKPGSQFVIPVLGTVTPAENLAQTVAAEDDKLTGTGVTVTVKEAVKSIAMYDRAKVQSAPDINRIAGQKVGVSINDRLELDLGAAAVAGRNTAADVTGASFGLTQFRSLRGKLPSALRRRGAALFAESATLDALFATSEFTNASNFGSDEYNKTGFIKRFMGVDIYEVDDGILPAITVGKKTVLMASKGALIYAFQRGVQVETERNARARITRVVGTVFHGEGVVDARGIVAADIGA